MNRDAKVGNVINRDKLPADFPTHLHRAEFWEALGRTIATFGFLEEVLGKAIFAFTGTRRYEPEQIDAALKTWNSQLEQALIAQLWNLAELYGKAARDNPAMTTKNVDKLVEDIKIASKIRNVLCHGSWAPPDANGASRPLFVNKQVDVFDTPIDIAFLRQVQSHVADLSCSIMESVTCIGWQFPGSGGPGQRIF